MTLPKIIVTYVLYTHLPMYLPMYLAVYLTAGITVILQNS